MTDPDAEHCMNISSIVVKTTLEHFDDVMDALKTCGLCDVHFHDQTGKIIVTVEGEGAGEEMKKMREIMNLPHVLSAELAYSYSENELDRAKEEIDSAGSVVPEALNS